MRKIFTLTLLILIAISVALSIFISTAFWWLAGFFIALFCLGVYDMIQTHHSVMRNFPLFGRARWLMEYLRPKLYQYFVESDTDGRPINRIDRSTIYQRAKKQTDSMPFGTQLDVYAEGYEWMTHSI